MACFAHLYGGRAVWPLIHAVCRLLVVLLKQVWDLEQLRLCRHPNTAIIAALFVERNVAVYGESGCSHKCCGLPENLHTGKHQPLSDSPDEH